MLRNGEGRELRECRHAVADPLAAAAYAAEAVAGVLQNVDYMAADAVAAVLDDLF